MRKGRRGTREIQGSARRIRSVRGKGKTIVIRVREVIECRRPRTEAGGWAVTEAEALKGKGSCCGKGTAAG